MKYCIAIFTFWYALLAIVPVIITLLGTYVPGSSIIGMLVGVWLAARRFAAQVSRAASTEEASRFAWLALAAMTLVWLPGMGIAWVLAGKNALLMFAIAHWLFSMALSSVMGTIVLVAGIACSYVVAYFLIRIVFEWRSGKLAQQQQPASASASASGNGPGA